MSEYDKAIEDYSEIIRLNPEDDRVRTAYSNRAFSYISIGEYDKAIEDYSEIIRLNPEDSGRYCARASAYEDKGDYNKAITDLTKAIQLQSEDFSLYSEIDFLLYSELYFDRAVIYHYSTGDYDMAIKDYDEAIKFNPMSARTCNKEEFTDFDREIWISLAIAYNNRGAAYHYKKGKYDRAIEDYNQAIRLAPGNAAMYLNRGYAYDNKGDYDRAIRIMTMLSGFAQIMRQTSLMRPKYIGERTSLKRL